MKTYDCVFIHPTTHIKNADSTKTDSITYVIMPLGTLAIADLLDREGYEVKVVHTGIEEMLDRDFSLKDLFKKHEVSVVGIDLHWYVHSYDAVRLAEKVKRNSNAFVVLGGFTASYFAEEILQRFESVDAVIQGDAETPLLELLKRRSDNELDEVPNIVYREGKSLKKGRKRFIAETPDLDKLNFTNFTLLSNFEQYRRCISQFGDLDPYAVKSKLKTQGWICMGRGCSVNCSYCGGGRKAFEILSGRQYPIFRSKEKVVETLLEFEEMKISCAYMDFDPLPQRRDYQHKLFDLIRKEKIDISAQYLLWSLSDRRFLRDFQRTFNSLYSTVSMSPESGSEQIRKQNKGFYYSNRELFSWLDKARKEIIPVQLYFTSGLSGDTIKHFEETIKLGNKLVDDYNVVSISCSPIEMEPASPRFLHPKNYGVSLKVKTFDDYYNIFKGLASGLPISTYLGYRTDFLSENEIIELSKRFRETTLSTHYKKWQKFYFGN